MWACLITRLLFNDECCLLTFPVYFEATAPTPSLHTHTKSCGGANKISALWSVNVFVGFFQGLGPAGGREEIHHQNVLTLPLGPWERSKDWYARARLAVNTMGYYSVGCGQEHPQGTYIFTNVVEKPWRLSAAMTEEFVSSALPASEDRKRISWWSDVGNHFRSYLFLTWVATKLIGLPVCRVNMDYNFGPEQHFKNQVDGMFGWLREAIRRISKVHILLTLDDLIKWLEEEPLAN